MTFPRKLPDIPDRIRLCLPPSTINMLVFTGIVDVDTAQVAGFMPMDLTNQMVNPTGTFRLSSIGGITALFWTSSFMQLTADMLTATWFAMLGPIRDQLGHIICWAYVSTDMVSARRRIGGLTTNQSLLSVWCLCRRCKPQHVEMDPAGPKIDKRHKCYGWGVKEAIKHVETFGASTDTETVKERERPFFCAEEFPTPPVDVGIKSVISVDTLEEALQYLHKYPIAADLVAYSDLFRKGDQIYYGPTSSNSHFMSYHAVILESVMYVDDEPVALCKLSNGVDVGNSGYVSVSLATVYTFAYTDENKHRIRPTPKPTRLLTNFTIILDVKQEYEKVRKEGDEKKRDRNWEENDEEEPRPKIHRQFKGIFSSAF